MEWFHFSHEQVVAMIEFAARGLEALPAQPPAPSVDAHTLPAVNAATPGTYAEVGVPFK
jgi:hypothetical protein